MLPLLFSLGRIRLFQGHQIAQGLGVLPPTRTALSHLFRGHNSADRLRQRSDKTTDELLSKPNVLVVRKGEEVSVVFNTFFEIQR